MCTMVTGFEDIVREDLVSTFSSIKNIEKRRGKVFFNIEKGEFSKLLKIKSVDNFYYFIKSFPIGPHKKDLEQFKNDICKIDLQKLCRFSNGKRIIVSASKKGKHTYSRFDISNIATDSLISKFKLIEGDNKNHDIAVRIDVEDDNCNVFVQVTDPSFKFRGENFESSLGGIRPSIANCLLKISGINDKDIFLDPFCGAGTIARERSFYKARKIFASDIDEDVINKARENCKNNVCILCEDATKTSFKDNYIDVIVSNIPWGKQIKVKNISKLYFDFLCEAKRILKENGCMVLLTDREELEKESRKAGFNLKTITTLSLHGSHPRVYCLNK